MEMEESGLGKHRKAGEQKCEYIWLGYKGKENTVGRIEGGVWGSRLFLGAQQ